MDSVKLFFFSSNVSTCGEGDLNFGYFQDDDQTISLNYITLNKF